MKRQGTNLLAIVVLGEILPIVAVRAPWPVAGERETTR